MVHDAIVIGSGAGGRAAALEAAEQGLDVLLVDDGSLSMSGFLRREALTLHLLRELAVRRLRSGSEDDRPKTEPRLHWRALTRRAKELARAQARLLRKRLDDAGVRVEPGPARLLSPTRLRIGPGCEREAAILVLASSCRPRRPARFGFDDRVICDNWSVCRLDRVPRNLLVVGAEDVGCELACLFAALGANVTLLDRRRQMLRYVDRDAAEILHAEMRRLGIEVVLAEKLLEVELDTTGEPYALVRLESGRVDRWARVLVAAGRVPNVESLQLDRAGVATDPQGFILTDEFLATSQAGIYAAGEAVASAAGRIDAPQQGRSAVRHALGLDDASTSDWPIAIHAIPEIAMVGLTEEMCQRLDVPHVVGTVRFEDMLYGRILGERWGMLKILVAQQDHRLLGVHIVGSHARELVQIGAAALRREEPVEVLAGEAFTSPSLSEAYRLAALCCLQRLPQQSAGGRGPSADANPWHAPPLDAPERPSRQG